VLQPTSTPTVPANKIRYGRKVLNHVHKQPRRFLPSGLPQGLFPELTRHRNQYNYLWHPVK
ncbi:uncharacterized protein METZ01_LOCUS94133, partial [marine metagenome]